ncbi:hypothetical protein BC828DRAFT_39617, partial [Blastocladiella britannica]
GTSGTSGTSGTGTSGTGTGGTSGTECHDHARVAALLSLLASDPRGGAPYMTVLIGPAGVGKTAVLKRAYNRVLESLSSSSSSPTDPTTPKATTLDGMYYVNFTDAFKRNTTDVALAATKFLDFLDAVQQRSRIDGSRLAVVIDGADHLPAVFGDSTAAVVRHMHETGAFAHVVMAFSDPHIAAGVVPKTHGQVGKVLVPYISDRHALVEYVRGLREHATTQGAANVKERWDLDDEVLVELVGGQFDDYTRLVRAVVRGRETLSAALADLLADSQERIEHALGLDDSATPIATSLSVVSAAYIHAADAMLAGRPPLLPRSAMHALKDASLVYRSTLVHASGKPTTTAAAQQWHFWYPRDRAVAAWLLGPRAPHAHQLRRIRAAARDLVDGVDDEDDESGVGRRIVLDLAAASASRSGHRNGWFSWLW